MIDYILTYIQTLLHSIDYLSIFIFMAIESSFIPFPSEVIMVPAGFLAASGKLNLLLSIVIGSVASVVGAIVNYMIGKYLGRKYILRHKRFFFINEKHLLETEKFFDKHGNITTFVGRLIPVFRQYVSIPAGFSNMNFFNFIMYTFLGAFIWVAILAVLGFFVGQQITAQILHIYNIIMVVAVIMCVVLGVLYWYKIKFKKKK